MTVEAGESRSRSPWGASRNHPDQPVPDLAGSEVGACDGKMEVEEVDWLQSDPADSSTNFRREEEAASFLAR